MPGNHTGTEVLDYRYGRDFSRFDKKPKIIYQGYGYDGKAIARGLEQRDFENLGGLTGTANKRNPVGQNNPNRTKYLNAADEHLKNNATPPKMKIC